MWLAAVLLGVLQAELQLPGRWQAVLPVGAQRCGLLVLGTMA